MSRGTQFDSEQQQAATGGSWDSLRAFLLHTAGVLFLLIALIAGISLAQPQGDPRQLKLVATALAVALPFLAGFAVARMWPRRTWCRSGRQVWLAGLIILAAASVWISSLPTGPGQCDGCSRTQKLTHTFFVFDNGSGLMNGDGLLVGCWVPLATLGYSLGVALGLRL
jgi:hypothetical protein